ncbi:hypothetical protein QJS10_CPA01g02379 [Acorus calamus]|uniref:Uncharacterized protein n=1 Tax=Acorus calamus TaxID=4465 RepID=A0AAV9FKW2_ACOCL|nr:hypothetical protein QJS10_CPA01g02379 [Acorus calamus]
MEKNRCGQASPVVKKEKKKQGKDDLDRLKQAEKKKRRLEKALAASAAIRLELEMKKQQKKEEELQRLDEEGAAIAEAVALHVLLGEDSDNPCRIVLNNNMLKPTEHPNNIDLFMEGWRANLPHQGFWVSDGYGAGYKYHEIGTSRQFSSVFHGNDVHLPYFEDGVQRGGISAGLSAAEAVSSLQIAENPHSALTG